MALLTKNHLTMFSGDGSGFSRLCRGGGERGRARASVGSGRAQEGPESPPLLPVVSLNNRVPVFGRLVAAERGGC